MPHTRLQRVYPAQQPPATMQSLAFTMQGHGSTLKAFCHYSVLCMDVNYGHSHSGVHGNCVLANAYQAPALTILIPNLVIIRAGAIRIGYLTQNHRLSVLVLLLYVLVHRLYMIAVRWAVVTCTSGKAVELQVDFSQYTSW